MTELTLYNSLTRKKEPFTPIDPKRVTMYNCGPTVYSYAHIGNARAAVVADVLFRVLRYIYGEEHVVYARNITDVDDKIIAAAKDQGVDISEITEKYARIYNEDLAALGCLPPTHQPKATENIQEMADIIVALMEKDVAYASEGHVFFDVSKHAEYGALSGNSLDQLKGGDRVGEGEVARKRNAADFVLWKPAKQGEVGWKNTKFFSKEAAIKLNTEDPNWRDYSNEPVFFESGRPGWHIECSAMIRNVLGETIDIHCGGIDLKFPHHENEIAQSECANDKPLANFWVHNEFLNMGSEKMSKSLGNIKLISNLLKDWDGEVIRLALLKAHYRSELLWSEDLLVESKAQLDGWYRAIKHASKLEGLTDDLNIKINLKSFLEDIATPEFVSQFAGLANPLLAYNYKTQNSIVGGMGASITIPRLEVQYHKGLLIFCANLIGLLQHDPEDWFRGNTSSDDESKITALIAERKIVKAAAISAKAAGDKAEMGKQFSRSDEIRDEISAMGIVLEDHPDGSTTWRKG